MEVAVSSMESFWLYKKQCQHEYSIKVAILLSHSHHYTFGSPLNDHTCTERASSASLNIF